MNRQRDAQPQTGAKPGSMTVLVSTELAVSHGFLGRTGGVSSGPFASLNLRYGSGDGDESVAENRRRLLEHFAADADRLCLLEQVHGDTVVPATPEGEPSAADAHYTAEPGLLLAISTADCLPILFHDPASGAVAAAHCGWRGTLDRLAARVVATLVREYGAKPAGLRVAIGPGICASCYQVGPEFRGHVDRSGLRDILADDPVAPGRFRLDLKQANRLVLAGAGVERIDVMPECTSCLAGSFFSHRRDRGVTGRQWSVIKAG